MFSESYKDITDLSYGLTRRLVYARPEEIDLANTMDFHLQDVMVEAKSCEYEYDLKDTWVTYSRWTSLVRQYLDPVAVAGFLDMVEDKLRGKKRGVAFLRTQAVAARRTASNNKEWRRWGSCMLGFGYRAMPKPTLTLHSRTTYLGYVGQLDLALAHVIAREIGKRVGLEPKDIAFVWHIEAAQFHSFKSLAWFYQHDRDRDKLENTPHTDKLKLRAPVLYRAQVRLLELQKMDTEKLKYCDMSFAQQLRIRRRLHTEVYGPKYGKEIGVEGGTRLNSSGMDKVAAVLPSLPVASLTLAPLDNIYVDDMSESFDKVGLVDHHEEKQ